MVHLTPAALVLPARNVLIIAISFRILEFVFARLVSNALKQYKSKDQSRDLVLGVVTRLIGACHNFVQLPLALTVLADASFWGDPMRITSTRSMWMLQISAGYFLHDAINCIIRYELEGFSYLVHGVYCFCVYSFAIYGNVMHYYGAAYLMWEASTPFVHLRWLLWKFGMAETKAYTINGICMILMFFCCRIVWGTYISTEYVIRNSTELANSNPSVAPWVIYFCFAAIVSLNSLNYYWFYKMTSRAYIVLKSGSVKDAHHEKDE